ncbi:Hypothetical_protein [Hexamita inflata]|uniref:Hypothetical_protein n=1 Tax=Hexamita inflata TaxID=28002 RepID=A0AA86UIJ1_9EUKA|nr:Hypothetical protein HINF_LOCUS36090 [Hexamita inflata]CAI9959665.1 Hypothetical protein HINF_LOCUS47310 [Hexamita inflata]
MALACQCFHFQNGLNPSFMPTQQRPSRALTESLADQFHMIRQLNFKKLVLASRFFLLVISFSLHGRLIRCIGIAWWWLPLMHWFINLIRFLGSMLVYLFLQIPNFGVYCWDGLAISQGLVAQISSLALYCRWQLFQKYQLFKNNFMYQFQLYINYLLTQYLVASHFSSITFSNLFDKESIK